MSPVYLEKIEISPVPNMEKVSHFLPFEMFLG